MELLPEGESGGINVPNEEDFEHEYETSGNSSSEENDNELEDFSDTPPEQILELALKSSDLDFTINAINYLRNQRIKKRWVYVGLDSKVNERLWSICTDAWPEPVNHKSPYYNCNDPPAQTEGKLRNHFRNIHQYDTSKIKDNIVIIIELLTRSRLRLIQEVEGNQTAAKIPQIHYHCFEESGWCSYSNINDYSLELRQSIHKHFKELNERIGLFWSIIKQYYEKTDDFPIIRDMAMNTLVKHCSLCGQYYMSEADWLAHWSRKHPRIDEKPHMYKLGRCEC